MPSKNNLSEDWEDLGDDNLSVISLPTSEPETPPAEKSPRAKPSAPTSSTSISGGGSASASKNISEVAKPVQGKAADLERQTEPAGARDSPSPQSRHEAQSEPLEDPFRDPPSTLLVETEADEAEENSDAVLELLDDGSHVADPCYLRKSLASLEEILTDTHRMIADSVTLGPELMNWSLSICFELLQQIRQLQPIVSFYARFSAANGQTLPIDSSLHGWLSTVRVKVLGLQAEIQRLGRQSEPLVDESHNYQTLWQYADVHTRTSELVGIWDSLNEYKKQMAEFLPIIQADFDEFHTKNLTFITSNLNLANDPSASRAPLCRSAPIDIPQPATSPRMIGSVPPPINNTGANNSAWLLRRDLYTLKDTLQRATEKLNFASASSGSTGILEWSAALAERYTALVSALGVVVSNHPSDWLDSTINGMGLSYPEFCSLDRETMGLYRAQLVEVVGEEEIDNDVRISVGSRHGRNRDRQLRIKPNGDELELLEGIAEALERMFKLSAEAYGDLM